MMQVYEQEQQVAAVKQQQQHQEQEQPSSQFVPLTGAIISYIVDIINHPPHPGWMMVDRPYRKYDIILNVYKAFECFDGMEEIDALWNYKKNIQHFIANYLFGEVMNQLRVIGSDLWLSKGLWADSDFELVWYNSTDREVMYFYDVLFGNPEFILNSDNDHRPPLHITAELFDCNYYLTRLQFERNREQHINEPLITIQDIPVIRLLEEALYNKSADTIICLIKSGLYNKHMPLYIYLKHNHKVWGADNRRSLADSEMLFDMMLNANVANDSAKSLLLEIAIGGLLIKHTNVEYLFCNVVNPNLALVKKMVPAHFPRDKELMCLLGELNNSRSIFAMKHNEFEIELYATNRTPLQFWEQYRCLQIFAPLFANGKYEVFENPRNEEIGKYLRSKV